MITDVMFFFFRCTVYYFTCGIIFAWFYCRKFSPIEIFVKLTDGKSSLFPFNLVVTALNPWNGYLATFLAVLFWLPLIGVEVSERYKRGVKHDASVSGPKSGEEPAGSEYFNESVLRN